MRLRTINIKPLISHKLNLHPLRNPLGLSDRVEDNSACHVLLTSAAPLTLRHHQRDYDPSPITCRKGDVTSILASTHAVRCNGRRAGDARK